MRTQMVLMCAALMVSGCASSPQQKDTLKTQALAHYYENLYQGCLAHKDATSITKEGTFEWMRERVFECFAALNYRTVIYSDDAQGLFVFAKSASVTADFGGDKTYPCKIILAHSDAGAGKTRLDFVRVNNTPFTNSEVGKDIASICEMLKRGW